MAKLSIGDKLKVIFSKEKGKDICDYLYKNVVVPTAKNTLYQMGSIAWAKFCNIDIADVPTLPNSHTNYSKPGTVSDKRQPDKPSYLPGVHIHGDVTTIPFQNPRDAYALSSKMEEQMRGPKKCCTVADVYEHLKWGSEILSTDYSIGWSGVNGVIGIGVLKRDGMYYVQAPPPKRLPGQGDLL